MFIDPTSLLIIMIKQMIIFPSQIVYCEDDFHSPTASTSPPASPTFHLQPRRRRKTSSGTRHKDEEGEITIECQRLNREHQLEKVGCISLKIFLPNIDIIASVSHHLWAFISRLQSLYLSRCFLLLPPKILNCCKTSQQGCRVHRWLLERSVLLLLFVVFLINNPELLSEG